MQPTTSKVIRRNGLSYVQAGTIDQPITNQTGDLICIDWGYAYIAGNISATTAVSLGDFNEMKASLLPQEDYFPARQK